GLIRDAETTAEQMAAAMERYNEEVIATVPAERLLVWSVSEGWEPLCEFLQVPVPDADFPRVNDSKEFGERIIDAAVEMVRQYRLEDESVGAAR
ncbi:MAG TPA: sulfotransferase, partial [Solirubrobacteraceae bacterium]|nr:sulfotransferase [Solirubrobacteraceae bacterium]